MPVSIFDLEGPSVISDVCNAESGVGVGVQYSLYKVFALSREKLW